ncbi:MAG: hypothetical protein ACWGQW_25410 [bacterium]
MQRLQRRLKKLECTEGKGGVHVINASSGKKKEVLLDRCQSEIGRTIGRKDLVIFNWSLGRSREELEEQDQEATRQDGDLGKKGPPYCGHAWGRSR